MRYWSNDNKFEKTHSINNQVNTDYIVANKTNKYVKYNDMIVNNEYLNLIQNNIDSNQVICTEYNKRYSNNIVDKSDENDSDNVKLLTLKYKKWVDKLIEIDNSNKIEKYSVE
ncbi:MAG: hypothetical protein Faunusvirus22_11 [Faunusvirus sp.]|jgi:hypothetical protein|uniref:Uncharacterized protein n=1 Tax=Faunusvirus sp. TaxID=2487766 RepID=A0A3G4ZXI9_9VIRU|nr:MAG: hypothetical protein Faunusvirus22_11 [Faunusvirus sp.]